MTTPPPQQMFTAWPRTLVRCGVAMLLLTAAGLKAWALYTQPFSSYFLLGSRAAEMALVYAEVLLAVWLLSGWRWPLAWLAAVGLFLIFTAASGHQLWEGQSSCGCFGNVEVSPKLTLALDTGVLLLLLLVRPDREEWQRFGELAWPRKFAFSLGVALVLLAAGFSVLVWQTGSAAAALASLRGDRLTVHPALADLGLQPAGTTQEIRVEVRNHATTPIRLVGGTTDCGCATTVDLPLTVPAGGTASLRLQIRMSGAPGRFQRGYWFWTDHPEHPQVVAWFTGRVGPPAP